MSGRLPLATVSTLTLGLLLGGALRGAPVAGQSPLAGYTRYELQAPGSGVVRILYDVAAGTPGARHDYHPLATGAREEVHGVTDLHTGSPLRWRVVGGGEARERGHPAASLEGRYLEVELPRPVPAGGEVRLRIDSRNVDPASYRTEAGGAIVFTRSLSAPRNSVVLPPGYELTHVNAPSQVDVEEDGRLRITFMDPGEQRVLYTVRARPLPAEAAGRLAASARGERPAPEAAPDPTRWGHDGAWAPTDRDFGEQAAETRQIVYLLEQPGSGAFRLYHDHTETRPGVAQYRNVVRAGSRVADPQAFLLDTGEELPVETLRGPAAVEGGVLGSGLSGAGGEVVVVNFPPPVPGGSARLRIYETYIDPSRYFLAGDELVWDGSSGGAMNRVVLPRGWFLTHSDMPASVEEDPEGRIALTFWNPRADGLQLFLRARERHLPVARSLVGEPLYPRVHPDPALLARADSALAADPENVERLIEAARERRNALLYDEEVALYDRALALAPGDWRLYRFRGHRLLSLRRFEDGLQDLDRALALAPRDFDVSYHRGLALYLLGRFDEAADEYLRCMAQGEDPAMRAREAEDFAAGMRPCASVTSRDDTWVAAAEWAYRALRRAGREVEARALVERVRPEMRVQANAAYHQALLARTGAWDRRDLLLPLPPSGRFETRAYGMALDELLDGDRDRALFLLRRVAEDPHWPGFGRIAAEADLVRMGWTGLWGR